MNVRCNYCGSSFNINRDYLIQVVDEVREKNQKYHAFECVSCRKMVKVSLKQMQRFVPDKSEKSEGD